MIDPLTGLIDRFGCLQSAKKLIFESQQRGIPCAVIWIDIDRFKQLNASFGHLGGDKIILSLAQRLRRRFETRAECSRMGGDEFVFLVSECNQTKAHALAAEITQTIETPITIDQLLLRPTASIGIAIHDPGEDSLALLERADRAMYAAKKRGGANIVCSGEEPVPGRLGVVLAREELEIESKLHAALESGGLCLHYQPIIRADGTVEAVEALMRCSANGENIPPGQFIPVAEKTGIVIRLGEWCLLQGAMYARQLQSAGIHTKVAINVSRAQLISSKFTQALHAALICSNVRPDCIELELTESLFMDISDTVQNNLKSATAAGVGLAIDDFGTGYSCLANLKDLPAQKLKLDRAFVSVLPEDRRALAVVRAMTQLGHELGMTVVAEGCERLVEIQALLDAGVDAIQGFYYAKPMPEDVLFSWLKNKELNDTDE